MFIWIISLLYLEALLYEVKKQEIIIPYFFDTYYQIPWLAKKLYHWEQVPNTLISDKRTYAESNLIFQRYKSKVK